MVLSLLSSELIFVKNVYHHKIHKIPYYTQHSFNEERFLNIFEIFLQSNQKLIEIQKLFIINYKYLIIQIFLLAVMREYILFFIKYKFYMQRGLKYLVGYFIFKNIQVRWFKKKVITTHQLLIKNIRTTIIQYI